MGPWEMAALVALLVALVWSVIERSIEDSRRACAPAARPTPEELSRDESAAAVDRLCEFIRESAAAALETAAGTDATSRVETALREALNDAHLTLYRGGFRGICAHARTPTGTSPGRATQPH